MATYNRVIRVKVGSLYKVITATFYDDRGIKVDLSLGGTWEAHIAVTAKGSDTNLLSSSAMTVRDQTLYLGQAQYTMSATDVNGVQIPGSVAGIEYDIELYTIDPNGKIDPYPNVPGECFGTLIMRDSKLG